MKRKRTSVQDNEVDGERKQKIIKQDSGGDKKDGNFDVKHFRKEIKSKTGNNVALTQFLQVCNTANATVDYLQQYLDAGGCANEILRQLNEENKKNPLVVTPVFSLLHIILTKIQSSYPQQLQQSEETCRYFLNTYISTIDFMLSEKSNTRQQTVTLKLLTIIVTLNSELAFTVLNQLSLQPKTLCHLVKRQHNLKEKDDVRKSFIFFLMSFFLDGNTTLIKSFLDKQGLIQLIVPDLVHDKYEIVFMVLELLKKHVINNQNISKTIKIRTFNQSFLANTFNLFNWKGYGVKTEDGSQLKFEIEELVLDFLLTLFTSHKHGVYFTDKLLGTGDTPTNHYLCKAIESLEDPWNNDKAGKLIIKIISLCPDLNKPILNLVERSFEPRHSAQWMKTITFLKELYNNLPAEHVLTLMSTMSPPQIINFVRNVYLPSKILQSCNVTLNSTDLALKYQIVALLEIMLNCVKSFLSRMDLAGERFIKVKILLKNRLEDFLPKNFPSTDLLISVLHSVLDGNAVEETSANFKIPAPESGQFIIGILDLLLTYNSILSNTLDPIATMLDSKRLLERVEIIEGTTNVGELKLKIIMFLLGADKFAFAPEKPLFTEILSSMLEVYVASDTKLSQSARSVLYNILETTNIFERDISEIDLLLSVVKIVGKDCNEIVKHVVKIIVSVLKNLTEYTENIAIFFKDENSDSALSQYVDIYFKNLINENEFDCGETVLTVEKTSIAPFVIGLLKYKEKTDENFMRFVRLFLVALLHNQESPRRLLDITDNYDDVDTSVKKYIKNWLTKPVSISGKIVNKTSLIYKLSNALLNETGDLSIKDLFTNENASHSFTYDGVIYSFCVEECLPYVNLCVDLILFYIVHQNQLNVLNLKKLQKAEKVLFCLLQMSLTLPYEKNKNIRLIIEKCLMHKVLIQKFSPFDKENSLITQFVINFVSSNVMLDIETNFIYSLLKPYKHKLYVSLMLEIKKSNDMKKGVILKDVSSILSTIDLVLNDANIIVREILKMDVNCMITDENEASSWIYVLCYVIKLFVRNSKPFSHRTIQNISTLYCKIIKNIKVVLNLQEFEESFYNYLLSNPASISSVLHKVFEAIFAIKHINKSTSNLACLLLKNDSTLLKFFKVNIIKDEIIQKRELVLPLTNAAFTHNVFAANTIVIKEIYDKYKTNIVKILEKPHKASQIYIDHVDLIVKLINKCMDVNECEVFCKKVIKYETLENFHISLLEEIYYKAYFNKKDILYLNNFLTCILSLTNVAFKKENEIQIEKINRVARCIQQFLLIVQNEKLTCDNFGAVCDSSIFQTFFKNVLKLYVKNESNETSTELKNCCLFSMTSSLIDILYPENHQSILSMFEMTTSHSEFLNAMLSNRQTNTKTQLVKLLLVMTLKNKEVMKSAHLPLYLSSYHASMLDADRYLLCLLKLYEKNGYTMNEYQPYLWGETAANHYAVRSSRKAKSSLWSNPTANHILNLLDKEMIERTIKEYPMNATLNTDEEVVKDLNYLFGFDDVEMKSIQDDVFNILYAKERTVNVDFIKCNMVMRSLSNLDYSRRNFNRNIYDPAFILPLLNYVTCPGSAVSCHRIIRGGIMSIPLVALSSNCSFVRAAAFNILHRFYTLLESEMYYRNDKILWSQFIDTLKSSLESLPQKTDTTEETRIPKLPTLGALYLARSALVMTNPLDAMFKPINGFVISKQYINFTVIPDFLDLFHNTDITFLERRTWMLKLLKDGIKLTEDIDVVLKTVAFKMILNFYSSFLCDTKQKILILELLNSCVEIPKTAKLLVEGFGLFPWLNNVFKDLNVDNKNLLSVSIKLLNNLWLSLVLETNKVIHGKFTDETVESSLRDIVFGKSLKLGDTLENNIMNLIIELSPKLSNLSQNDLELFLSVLNKMSKNCLKLLSKRNVLNVVESVKNLYPNSVAVNALFNIVKDPKKDVFFNNSTLSELPYSSGEEKLIIFHLNNVLLKWILLQ